MDNVNRTHRSIQTNASYNEPSAPGALGRVLRRGNHEFHVHGIERLLQDGVGPART
ncbi:hypothetical protein C2E23DRAFT_835589 [Lenzites betulinus]|nr:hypothetical protein C2E23DRAFT_835589 [Lenzites betulinus]